MSEPNRHQFYEWTLSIEHPLIKRTKSWLALRDWFEQEGIALSCFDGHLRLLSREDAAAFEKRWLQRSRSRIKPEVTIRTLNLNGWFPESAWSEDDGSVIWVRVPVQEPPYIGTPLDSDWEDGYYTHWTHLPPKIPEVICETVEAAEPPARRTGRGVRPQDRPGAGEGPLPPH